jgi:hypothetical protein
LQESGETLLLEGFLKIFEPKFIINTAYRICYARPQSYAPSIQFVKHVDILLQLFDVGRVACVENRERRHGRAIIKIRSTWLDEPADKEDLKQGVGIFEILECPTSLYKFSAKSLKIVLWNCFKMFIELVSKD